MVSYPPGWRRPPDLDKEIRKKHRNQDSLVQMTGEVDRTLEIETPLKFKQRVPLRKKEFWKKRILKGQTERSPGFDMRIVWRDPRGRFICRPKQGERARTLNLPNN